jgi:hypothetical protein
MLDIETVTQKPDDVGLFEHQAPVPQQRNAAKGETPIVSSIGSTKAAAVMTPSALEPVTEYGSARR